jgi:FkbM family methyltransferase
MLPRVNLVRTGKADYLLFSTEDVISKAIFDSGEWEPDNLVLANILCENLDAPVALDIGANLGAFSVPLAQKLGERGGLVYSFEPQRVVFYQLCANIFLNRLDNCMAYNMGVGDKAGMLELPDNNYDSSNLGAYSLIPEYQDLMNLKKASPTALKHRVPIIVLDDFKFPRKVDFIKIDVEGMELQVLQGARRLLQDSEQPPIMLEAWGFSWFKEQREELIQYLKDMDYEILFINSSDAIAQHSRSKRYVNFSINPANNTLSYYFSDNSQAASSTAAT